MPLTADTFVTGPAAATGAVVVLMICKEYDLAMDQLELLLTIPGEGNYTPTRLRVDPLFDAIRDLPRFKKMLETDYEVVY